MSEQPQSRKSISMEPGPLSFVHVPKSLLDILSVSVSVCKLPPAASSDCVLGGRSDFFPLFMERLITAHDSDRD